MKLTCFRAEVGMGSHPDVMVKGASVSTSAAMSSSTTREGAGNRSDL